MSDGEEPWWRRALGRKKSSGDAADVPQAYAALQETDDSTAGAAEELVTEAVAMQIAQPTLAKHVLREAVQSIVARASTSKGT